MHTSARSRRRTYPELMLVAAVGVLALAVRCAYPGRLGIEHFDEGVYSSRLFSQHLAGQKFPYDHLYAPPLFPSLVEWSLVFTSGDLRGAFVPSLVAGVMSVILVWWIGRLWFGWRAGVAAAVLAATSDYHILHSRTVLTDTLFGALFLAGMAAIWRAVFTGRPGWIIFAGLTAAAAWWTKYPGWLVLAAGTSGSLAWALLGIPLSRPINTILQEATTTPPQSPRQGIPERGRRLVVTALICGALALITAAAWSPVPWELRKIGGYQTVSANHAKYFHWLDGWPQAARSQWNVQRFLEGPLSYFGALAAGLICLSGIGKRLRFTWNRDEDVVFIPSFTWIIFGAGILLTGLAWWGVIGVVAIAAVWGLIVETIIRPVRVGAFTSRLDPDEQHTYDARQLAGWLLAAWVVGLALGVPMYRAYPRLALPLLMGLWLAAGAGFSWLAYGGGRIADRLRADDAHPSDDRAASPVTEPFFGLQVAAVAVLVVGVLLWWGPRWSKIRDRGVVGWQDRSSLNRVARELDADIATELPAAGTAQTSGSPPPAAWVGVLGDPALYVNLVSRQSESKAAYIVEPIAQISLKQVVASLKDAEIFVVTTDQNDGDFVRKNIEDGLDFKLVVRQSIVRSHFVLLDSLSPIDLETRRVPRHGIYRLYRLRSSRRRGDDPLSNRTPPNRRPATDDRPTDLSDPDSDSPTPRRTPPDSTIPRDRSSIDDRDSESLETPRRESTIPRSKRSVEDADPADEPTTDPAPSDD